MRQLLTAFILIFFCNETNAQFQGLIVNEFSQGSSGIKEYIELLVAGNRTCTDSTADLRGWIFDDQNGWYGSSNSSKGHYRFKYDANWQNVPFGSIILIYNFADKNSSIILPNDPTDANRDYTYIVPNTSSYLEQNSSQPDNASPSYGPNYTYPTTGYVAVTNQWQFMMALNNSGGDVISIVNPSNFKSASFSIGYGYTINAGYQNPSVSIANVGSASNAYLSDSNYLSSGSWIIATVPTNETPGLSNGGVNTVWINSMRRQVPSIIVSSAATPVCYNGNAQTTTLAYSAITNSPTNYSIQWNASPSNSFININNAAFVSSPFTITIPPGAAPGMYTGNITVSNATGISCSKTFTVTVNSPQPTPTVNTIQPTCTIATGTIIITSPVGTGYTYSIDGNNYQSSNIFSDVALGAYQLSVKNSYGCVSGNVSVNINAPAGVVIQTIDSSGCEKVLYNGTVYTSFAMLQERISSLVTGCDSILRTVRIAVYPKPALTVSPNKTICQGDSATLTASSLNATIKWLGISNGNSITVMPALKTVYTAQATSVTGCTNTATVTVDVQRFNLLLFANPNPVIAGMITYLQTSANFPYQVLSWQPFSFTNPAAINQNLVADSTTKIVVIAKSFTGCRDTASVELLVDPIGKNIFIPSAFTPNGDGKNDVLRVLGGEIKELDMKIFNRWGQVVFSTRERSGGWDGTLNGKAQPGGVYVYAVLLILKDGTVINKKGTVLLIK